MDTESSFKHKVHANSLNGQEDFAIILEWFKERGMVYGKDWLYLFDRDFTFEDARVAVLFKLTWG